MKIKKSTLSLLSIAFISSALINLDANAQLFYSNGATVQVTNGGNIHINGGANMDNASSVVNDGVITTKNDVSPGHFQIDNTSVVSGNGDYNVEQDWINNATFNQGTSRVFLNGNTQLITGSNVTTFHELNLLNASKKTQTLNSNIDNSGTLNLNDCELATDQFTMFVLNPSTGAVTKTAGNAGFVSSLANGSLSRVTNQQATYLYPTGSSLGTTRYRPVEITPADNNPNVYTVRLANNDATVDGMPVSSFDNTVECEVNDKFYHKINHPAGTTNPDLAIYFDPAADAAFTGTDQWNVPTTSIWNNMGTVTTGANYGMSSLTKASWADFSNDGFALSRRRPNAPLLTGNTAFCPGTQDLMFVAAGGNSGSTYTWTFPAGTSFTTQGNDTVYATWNSPNPGVVMVTEDIGANCSSMAGMLNITPYANPVADFDTIYSGNFSSIYAFRDSSIGATSWSWDFGDNNTSTLQNPTHFYNDPGTYTVTQIVKNGNGCADTLDIKITLNEGIAIPNVFTPNGDGSNDLFMFPNVGLTEIHIKIFDRWGLLMFETSGANVSWDGKTLSGTNAATGTYYYLLDAKSKTKDYSSKGTVTLLRD